ncbi:MAG: transposase zinc-binding domain-containing protein [Nitrosomonas sp.]
MLQKLSTFLTLSVFCAVKVKKENFSSQDFFDTEPASENLKKVLIPISAYTSWFYHSNIKNMQRMACAQFHQKNLRHPAQHVAVESQLHYERHRPEETTLYRLMQEHIGTFFVQVETETGSGLSDFVKDEFEAFLECGILAHGFLRLHCANCVHEKQVAFSCKRRGFCPSCGGCRMVQTAAHLITPFPSSAGAPMGALTADPATLPVSRSSALNHTGIAGDSPYHLYFSDQTGRIEMIRSTDRCDYAYSTFRFGG